MSKETNKIPSVKVILLAVVVVWLLTPFVICKIFGYANPSGAGEFGDMFGAVNALFSGLAMCGVIYAVVLQSKELELQRKELKQTREEFKSQTAIFDQQRFEGTFFQMLKLYNEMVESFLSTERSSPTTKEEYVGRRAIWHDYCLFIEFVRNSKNISPNEFYSKFREEGRRNLDLNGYFRTIYHILKYIYNSSIEDKKRYSNLLRSQLSGPELGFLHYNCISDLGREKMKPLVDKYDILKHLPPNFLIEK